MRKLIPLLVAVLLTATVWAQAPQKMSYQAVIRDGGGLLVTNQVIGMEINIRQGSQAGTIVYTETQTPTTNENGLVSIEIGGGTSFNTINWATSTYYIETKTAVVAPLTTYTITGVSQLLSVPYALFAKTAESITGTITETDPIYNGSQAVYITANDITKLSNLSGTNTGDQDLSGLATTTSITTSLNLKVDKETGKGLSTNDYTNADATKVSNLSGTNTGDQDLSGLATITSVTTALNLKVDKVAGKGLSTNDYTNADATKVSNLSGTNTGDQDLSGLATTTSVTTALNLKVDKEVGKGLSTNDYTTAEQIKLAGIATGAQVNVKPDWTAASGNVAEILNKPTIPTAADGSETKVSAGTSVTVTGAGTVASPYVINSTASGSGTHYLGEEYLGGIIFNLYTTSDGTQHGLIVSKTETTATWSGSSLVGADRTEDGAYNMNLMLIGAGTARTWVETLGAGWYLPSVDELSILWHSRYYVNKTARAISSTLLSSTATYWSSTEYSAQHAFYFSFYTGNPNYNIKTTPSNVRAIRAF